MNRSSILRAIKRGALTGTKDHNDVWHVDGAELARVFPVTPNAHPAQQDTHPDALAAHSWRSPRNASPSLKNASTRCGTSAIAHEPARMHGKPNVRRCRISLHCRRPRTHSPRNRHDCAALGAGCGRPGEGYHGRNRRTRMDHIHRRRFPHPVRCLLDSPCSIAHPEQAAEIAVGRWDKRAIEKRAFKTEQ